MCGMSQSDVLSILLLPLRAIFLQLFEVAGQSLICQNLGHLTSQKPSSQLALFCHGHKLLANSLEISQDTAVS